MERRVFIKTSAAALSGLSILGDSSFSYFGKKYAYDKIKLGNTGIEVSRLAVGTGTSGWGGNSNQTRNLGIKGLSDLLRFAYDEGVLFWDSADQYGTHPHLKEALKHIPREKVVILTKTHATTEKEMKDDIDRFRKEIGTDYIDIMLLHLMTKPNWPEIKKGAMDVLSIAREDGIVKSHGVSCHSLSALKAAAESEWVQVDLARINYAGAVMDADVATVTSVLDNMKKSGKGIIGMKVLGDGRLSDNVDKSLQFVLSKEYVDCFTIGFENADELKDVMKRLPTLNT